jgi:penicillin amidase
MAVLLAVAAAVVVAAGVVAQAPRPSSAPAQAAQAPTFKARAAAAVSPIDGRLDVVGLAAPVEVLRDRWGVAHIYASTVEDLFLAQGFVAAQDRLWQLDLWRRTAMGELAEVFGAGFVDRDTFARLLRYRGDLDAEWRAYAPDARRIVEAFVRGINAQVDYVTAHPEALPVEFAIAGSAPERWTPEVVISRVAGYIMTRNARLEVQRAQLAARVGVARAAALLPPDPAVPLVIADGLDLRDITDDVLRITEGTGDGLRFLFGQRAAAAAARRSPWPLLAPAGEDAPGRADTLSAAIERTRDELATVGSNNWVVSPARSESGAPLLANDPHRTIQLPSLRYTVHLNGPGWNVIGAGEPALPGVAAGHNDRIAFGFTIVGIDQQDLYVERLDPGDPSRVLVAGGTEPMRVERTRIEVKGEAPRDVELRFTRHGPVLHVDRARLRAYALRWVGQEPGTAGYLASLSLNTARTWDEFTAAAARWAVPSENLIYADVDGNIGWVVAGLTPIRPGWNGLLPVPGHEGRFQWAGFVPAAELPRSFNPPDGVLATANHNILPPGYRRPLGYDWSPPHRFGRIVEALASKPRWSVADFEALQHDERSLPARTIVEALRAAAVAGKVAGRDRTFAIRMLTSWDGVLDRKSPAAALYQLWVPHLQRDLALVAYSATDRPYAPERLPLEQVVERMKQPVAADVDVLVGAALDRAMADARQQMGASSGEWAWGRIHRAAFEHPLAETEEQRAVMDLGEVPRGGDSTTINNTGSGRRQVHGASYRQVIDVGRWDRSTMTNVPGQSAQPGSPHYADLLPLWAMGRYHPMPFSREAVEEHTAARLLLAPPGVAARRAAREARRAPTGR